MEGRSGTRRTGVLKHRKVERRRENEERERRDSEGIGGSRIGIKEGRGGKRREEEGKGGKGGKERTDLSRKHGPPLCVQGGRQSSRQPSSRGQSQRGPSQQQGQGMNGGRREREEGEGREGRRGEKRGRQRGEEE
jgi:hypothetical protein